MPPKGSTQLQYPNVRRRLVESPKSSKIAADVKTNIGENSYARSNSKIEIKREISVVHAIHDSDGSNDSKAQVFTGFKGDSYIGTTTDGYIKLCTLNVKLSYFIVCSSINREISIEQIKSNVPDEIKIIHPILYTYTGIGAEVEPDGKVCF